MRTNLLVKRIGWLGTLLILMFSQGGVAEGTKQLMPLSTSFGMVQINDVGRTFALTTNTDSLNRLYIHIKSTTEKVYFGFRRLSSSVATSGNFRIKDPTGTIVYALTALPTSGAGFINDYTKATLGPVIGGVPVGGYTPLSLTPATTGDYYIEFDSQGNNNLRFQFFDITVATSAGVPIPGRVWSYAWDLNTNASSNAFTGAFYVYTNEGFVSRASFNGIRPFGFVVSCNNSGPMNTGNLVEDRKSINGNFTRPQFKVFFNNPDSTVYPTAAAPTLTSPFQIVGDSIYYGQSVAFTVGVSAPGTIQIIISLNGVSGYQSGTADVLYVANVLAGTNDLTWDGKDAYGNYPSIGTSIEMSTGFSAGVTHLPIYDPETNPSGYIVDRIRPGTGSAPIRWDDSNFSGGTVNISGGSGDGHIWATNFGDVRTMNTWWNGYEVENNDQFTVTVLTPLPVELVSFTGKLNLNMNSVLNWITSSEINSDYFIVEKKTDVSREFTPIGKVEAHGNSTAINKYVFEDMKPVVGCTYYRLTSVDFNGTTYQSKIIKICVNENAVVFDLFPNPNEGNELFLNFKNINGQFMHVEIISKTGQHVFSEEFSSVNDNLTTRIELPQLEKGIYFVNINADGERYFKKLLIR